MTSDPVPSPPEPAPWWMKPRHPRISGDDPWIAERSKFISPRKVHAIGEIALRWNNCELGLIEIFGAVSGLPTETAWAIAHDLPDNKLIEKIKLFRARRPLPKELDELLDNIFKVYNVCLINRNRLVHNIAGLGRGGLSLRKATKDYMKHERIKQSIGHIRRCAEAIEGLSANMREVGVVVGLFIERGHMLDDTGAPLRLPDTLALPESLWTPPPGMPPKRRRQPPP